MTEAESEVELGAAEEESTTEAAPQGPGIATKSTSTPGAAPLGASSSAGGAPGFSTIYPTATGFPPFSGMLGGPPSTAVTLPSCLMPESFNGSGDFEDYIQQFNTAAMLAGWLSPRHDHRPQYFALRLRDNALHFYTTLSPEQQDDYDLLVDAFRQNYTTNVDILKARLKAAKQQPEQEIANFLCDLRTLARRAYRASPHLIDQIVLTSFVEGLKSPTLRWELRKAKPRTVEEALTLAIELDSFIALERTNYPGSARQSNFSVSQIGSAIPQPDTIDELVRSLRNEVDNIKRSTHHRNDSRDKHRNRTDSLDKNRDRSNSRDHQPNYFASTDRNQQNSKYSGEKRNNSHDRNSRSVRFELHSRNESGGRNNYSRYGSRDQVPENQRQSPSHTNTRNQPTNSCRNDNFQNTQRNSSNSHSQPCRHCGRSNHSSNECKACFNCKRIGHFRRDCKAPRVNSLN